MDLAFAELEYTEQRVNPVFSTIKRKVLRLKRMKAPHKRVLFLLRLLCLGNQRLERSEGIPNGFLKSREFSLRQEGTMNYSRCYKQVFNSVTFLSPKSVYWSGFNFSLSFLISKI